MSCLSSYTSLHLCSQYITIKKSSTVLFICTFQQAFVRHPEVASAKHNRDFVMKQISDAVKAISGVAQAVGESTPSPFEEAGALAKALTDLLVSLVERFP